MLCTVDASLAELLSAISKTAMTAAPTTTIDTGRATSSAVVQHDGAPSVSVGLLILRLGQMLQTAR